MYRTCRLSLFMALILLLQLGLPEREARQVDAAALGPVVLSLSPADDLTNVQPTSHLKMIFDENVRVGPSTASINIYRSTDNVLVESIGVTTSRVTIASSNRQEVTIRPALSGSGGKFELHTDYYVLIDSGAFLNVSNSAAYSGIHNATVWNFRTVAVEDTTKPLYTSRTPEGNGHSVTTAIEMVFNENVVVGGGVVTLSATDDVRLIPVTSSSVRGSGTNRITISPESALLPNSDYEVRIASDNIQDLAGNKFDGMTWSFRTASAPVNLAGNGPFTPADDSTGVPISTGLTVRFDRAVQANSGKYVEIRRVSDNQVVVRYEATSSRVALSDGNTAATITPQTNLAANTAYYVFIEPGAFSRPSPENDQWFYGISAATIWNFTTGYGNNSTAPVATVYSPTRGGKAGSVNSLLTLTFDKEVFPNSGNIEIRTTAGGTLFRSIPITSARVTGGGSKQLVIDPNKAISAGDPAKPFVNNTQYYVTIGNRVIRDGAGNYFNGISGINGWTFTVTQDNVRPLLQSLSPPGGAVAVGLQTEFAATFNKSVRPGTSGNNNIYFVPVTASGNGTAIDAEFKVDPKDSKRILITPRAPAELTRNTNYYIYIEENAISDVAGNDFIGIMNQQQWAFQTVGGDTTAPKLARSEVNGNTLRLIYDESLDSNETPSPASFYVTVAGAPRNITAVKIEGNMVSLTLASAVGRSQNVTVSYTKPANRAIQDLSGNEAASFAPINVTNGSTNVIPAVTSGSASGNIIRLNFSESLMAVNMYAYTQFTVNIGGTSYTPTSLWHNGSVIQLTVAPTISSGQTVYVSYNPVSYPLIGVSGNTVGAFNNYNPNAGGGTGGGGVDTLAPYPVYIASSAYSVIITFSENLNSNQVPRTNQFVVAANQTTYLITNTAVSGNAVVLTLNAPLPDNETIRVTYTPSGVAIVDASGNAAAAFASLPSNTTFQGGTGQIGMLTKASIKSSLLTLEFNEPLSMTATVPTGSQFIVRVNDAIRAVTHVQVVGNTALLTLSQSVTALDQVLVSYSGSTGSLKTAAGQSVNSFANINADNVTSAIDGLGSDYAEADDGGVLIRVSGASTMSDTSPGGVSALRYVVDNSKFIAAVTALRNSGDTKPRIVFKVPDHERAALVAISVIALETASRQGDYVFAVQHGDATYELSASALDFAAITASAGGQNALNQWLIAIDKGSTGEASTLASALNRSGAQVIAGPVSFETFVVNGANKNKWNSFNGYVARSLKTSASAPSSQTAAVWLDPVTGALSYTPTQLKTENGVTRAVFMRKGNSSYALVRNLSSFSDISGHWAEDTLQMMARKYISEGRTIAHFEPDVFITRGEFAAYIAKGLGLAGDRTAASKFADVNQNTAMGAYIGAAAAAGIVNGVTNTSFKPDQFITREDMAAMMMRAAKAAGMIVTLPGSADLYLAPYTDRGRISGYAKTDVAQAVQMGIINGKTPTELSPRKNATRAEGVVMIKRLLEKANFLTP